MENRIFADKSEKIEFVCTKMRYGQFFDKYRIFSYVTRGNWQNQQIVWNTVNISGI